jgi:SAM-dependent methyltransferase
MSTILFSTGRLILRLGAWIKRAFFAVRDWLALNDYLRSDRRPWRFGYSIYRAKYIAQVVRDDSILGIFRDNKPLPSSYGFRVDARTVEIPWVLARVMQRSGQLLDAGSALNLDYVVTAPALANYKITIATLAPEAICLWNLGISYVFGDLRALDFRDDWFDAVVCISTIEHVGMDNALYAGQAENARRASSRDHLRAVKELRRVLKPGGVLYITFPFGVYEDHGWFQQFDAAMADQLIATFNPSEAKETVFRYDPDGWKLSDRAACACCEYFDVHTSKYFDPRSTIEYPPDYPAGERSVACLELRK